MIEWSGWGMKKAGRGGRERVKYTVEMMDTEKGEGKVMRRAYGENRYGCD